MGGGGLGGKRVWISTPGSILFPNLKTWFLQSVLDGHLWVGCGFACHRECQHPHLGCISPSLPPSNAFLWTVSGQLFLLLSDDDTNSLHIGNFLRKPGEHPVCGHSLNSAATGKASPAPSISRLPSTEGCQQARGLWSTPNKPGSFIRTREMLNSPSVAWNSQLHLLQSWVDLSKSEI